ncbi:MAG TPA: hypothetical protein VNK82_07660 [Terriglobales bacterium]|nr:hypothetical protein [Terriglobales bacterium]
METSLVESQLGGIMMDPLQCDGDGNIYIRFYQEGERRAPIKKFDTQGNRQATFSLEAVTEWDASELTAMYFSVNARGELHQIAWSEDLYVLTFNKDGSYKRRAKIEPLIIPAQVAEFASGEFLITGRKYEGKREDGTNLIEPFTGIFDSSGKLIKRLTFQDDQEIQKAVERGDSNFVNPLIPGTNRAISMGMAVTGEDGNVYVMRRTVPAVIYAVSSAGEVVRKLAVDPGDPGMMPSIMQLSKGRVAILFRSDATKEQIVKVVDSQSGEELVTYDANSLGPTLACYSGGQRFTFLSTRKGHLSLDHAEPR